MKEIRLQESDKVLVVYLSRTNNTKALAEIIHQEVGGDLVPLELINPYPENYRAIVKQVAEENETGFLPPLKTKVDIKKYETIFIGFPTWGMQLPPSLKSFLTENNLEGKTVIPFNSNAGYGVGSSFDTIELLCPKSKILEGFSIKGGKERDGIFLAIKGEKEKEAKVAIKSWLSKIKLGVVD
ncbi:flavodoxin family protein [Maribacter confluentis]